MRPPRRLLPRSLGSSRTPTLGHPVLWTVQPGHRDALSASVTERLSNPGTLTHPAADQERVRFK